MDMLLQDPYWRDNHGEYLHEDYPFPLDQDFLVGTGASSFIVQDSLDWETDLEWGDGTTGLAYKDFKQRAFSILDNTAAHKELLQNSGFDGFMSMKLISERRDGNG